LSDQHDWDLYPPKEKDLISRKENLFGSKHISAEEVCLKRLIFTMKPGFQRAIMKKGDAKDLTMELVIENGRKWLEANSNVFEDITVFDPLFDLELKPDDFDLQRLNNLFGLRSTSSPELYKAVTLNDQEIHSAMDLDEMNLWNNHLRRIIDDYQQIKSQIDLMETLIFDSSLLPQVVANQRLYNTYLSKYALYLKASSSIEDIDKHWVYERQFYTDKELIERTKILENSFVTQFNEICPNVITKIEDDIVKVTSSTLMYNPISKKYYPIDFLKKSDDEIGKFSA